MSTPPCQATVQENQANNSSGTPVLPARRKRGRPRKDDVPVSELSARTQQRRKANPHAIAPTDSLVGQSVSGVLDGSFDSGYLLSVRIGTTGPVLKGLVFDPRISLMISPENDIAPHLPMIQRDRSSPQASSSVGAQPPQNAGISRPLPRNEHPLAPALAQPAIPKDGPLQPLPRNGPEMVSLVTNESRPGNSEADNAAASATPQQSEAMNPQATVLNHEESPVHPHIEKGVESVNGDEGTSDNATSIVGGVQDSMSQMSECKPDSGDSCAPAALQDLVPQADPLVSSPDFGAQMPPSDAAAA